MNVVVSSFIKEYPDVNYDDLYDFVLETVMKKTGGLFINYKVTKALPFMLYQFLFKHCYNFLKSPFNQDLYFTFDEEKNYFSDTCDNSDGSFIDDYFFLTTEEQEFLKVMSTGIEEGFDYMDLLKETFCLSDEEVLSRILIIRNKIIDSGKNLDEFQKILKR